MSWFQWLPLSPVWLYVFLLFPSAAKTHIYFCLSVSSFYFRIDVVAANIVKLWPVALAGWPAPLGSFGDGEIKLYGTVIFMSLNIGTDIRILGILSSSSISFVSLGGLVVSSPPTERIHVRNSDYFSDENPFGDSGAGRWTRPKSEDVFF